MTECQNAEVRDLLPDLLHGRLDPSERRQVEAHLRGCAECRHELELLRRVHDLSRTPAVDVAAIVQALPAPRRRANFSWHILPAWRAAAAVVFLAAGGSAVLHYRDRPARVNSAPAVLGTSGDSTADVELAVGYDYTDLSDAQLQALLNDIQQMDAVPLAEPDMTHPMVVLDNGGM